MARRRQLTDDAPSGESWPLRKNGSPKCRHPNSRSFQCSLPFYTMAIIVAALSQTIPNLYPQTMPRAIQLGFAYAAAPNEQPANHQDAEQMAQRMAQEYTKQLEVMIYLLEETLPSSEPDYKETVEKHFSDGSAALEAALEAFPDETLPHAHALFAKLCTKLGAYEKSLEMYDEAIRRSQLSSQNGGTAPPEDEDLTRQLLLEKNRSHFSYLRARLNAWDGANHALHRGGIPPETSPSDALAIAQRQVNIFPNPHPQALFDVASFSVLLLDSPEGVTDAGDEANSTSLAWKAHETFGRAQTWAFGSYLQGKKRRLAGGSACGEQGFGLTVGGKAWSQSASESVPYSSGDDNPDNGLFSGDSSYMGTVTLEDVIISGISAVPSGHGANCRVYVPHPYVNLADNIPMVTSWETNVLEITDESNPLWITYMPGDDDLAYLGKRVKDEIGANSLKILDPKSSGVEFNSSVLLTGYAADNYYHFVSGILPSLVLMKDVVLKTLRYNEEGTIYQQMMDVVIVPNLDQEFIEGFFRLLLPEMFVADDGTASSSESEKAMLSPHIIQWGLKRVKNRDELSYRDNKFDEIGIFSLHHPIAFTHRLYAAVWDQPAEGPPPLGGPPHSLTPAPLLRTMQKAVWEAAGVTESSHEANNGPKLKIVYCSRSTSPTRKLQEEQELLSRLSDLASAMDAKVVIFEKAVGEASNRTSSSIEFVTETIHLFASARVVVGVHGAALANIAFARPGTTVVEMGLEGLPQANHYRHLSQSLGLRHVDIFLAKDTRSLGATTVELRGGGLKKVVDAVENGLTSDRVQHSEL